MLIMVNCLDYALTYISRFPKTEKELRIQLYTKGFLTSDVNAAIEELKKKNYINDELFAESYIRSEIINKGKPIIRVIQKLQQKGIASNIIKQIIKKYEDDIKEGIDNRIKKEITIYKKKHIEGFDIIQKLIRKGYKLSDIKRVITNK